MDNQDTTKKSSIGGITFKKEFLIKLTQGEISEPIEDACVNLVHGNESHKIILNVITFIPEDADLEPIDVPELATVLTPGGKSNQALVYFYNNTTEIITEGYRNLEIHYKTCKPIGKIKDFAVYYFRITYNLQRDVGVEKVFVRDVDHFESPGKDKKGLGPRLSRGTKTIVSQ